MLTGAGRTLTWLSFNKPANISGPGGTSTFAYDADRARYKQVVTSGTQTTTTLYVGKLYEKRTSGFDTEHVNFIRAAGQVVATVTTEGFSDTVEYLHRDHLGSVVKVTDGSGAVIEGLSYDAFGKRRNSDGTNDPGDSQYGVARATTLSFTGHEQLDHIKLVHMNGRIYDPIIGRFLSPDPFVQFPESTQGLNRYTYVNNNPLSLTDPSGYFIGSLIGAVVTALFADDIADLLEDNWRTIAAVAIASVVPYAGLELGGSILAGFASGVVASGGDLEAGLIGAATAGTFYSVGSAYSAKGAFGAPTSFGAKAGKVVLHGTVGGVSQELSGGKFGSGFLSAGFTQYAGQQGWIGGGSPAANVATSAMVGGTASALGGGKFANGAVTAAFARAFNDELPHGEQNDSKEMPVATDDPSWKLRASTLHGADELVVDAGQRIMVEISSTTPGVDGIRVMADVRPLTASGDVMPTHGPIGPRWREVGGHVGFNASSRRVLNAGFSGPGGNRWRVHVPPQQSVHDNSSGALVNVYSR